MTEPSYIAQTAEPMEADARRGWIRRAAQEAREKGITFMRVTVDDALNPKITLLEGWESPPDDQGEPRWQMTNLEGSDAQS